MGSRASAARTARMLTGHAVRRLTDESTNAHCTPLRRPEPRFGSGGATRIDPVWWPPDGRPRRPPPGRCARRGCPAGVRRRRMWGRRQPGRGAAQGGDQEADRARVPGRGDQEHHPHRRGGPGRRRRRRGERRLSGRHPRLPAGRGDPGRQRRLARRHCRCRARGSPLRAPILLTDGEDVSNATSTAVDSLRPTGAVPSAGRRRSRSEGRERRTSCARGGSPAKDTFTLAAAIDALATDVGGRPRRTS